MKCGVETTTKLLYRPYSTWRKRVVRTIHNAGCCDHTTYSFLTPNCCYYFFIYSKITLKASNLLLPHNIPKLLHKGMEIILNNQQLEQLGKVCVRQCAE